MLHEVKHVLPLPWYLKLRTEKHKMNCLEGQETVKVIVGAKHTKDPSLSLRKSLSKIGCITMPVLQCRFGNG